MKLTNRRSSFIFPAIVFCRGLVAKSETCPLTQCRQDIRSRSRTDKTIQRSSVVERSAVNRLVVGSNPTAGAKF